MKPLLAASKLPKLKDVRLPTLASPKLDGIRCIMVDGVAMSRNNKPIPNAYVQKQLQGLHGLDGELVLLDPSKDFNDCQSAFMRNSGQPEFAYKVFDYWDSKRTFVERLIVLGKVDHPRVQLIEQTRIETLEQLVGYYNDQVAAGMEGIICRLPHGPYKQGRSTLNEQYSIKLKPVKMDEAVVIGMDRLVDAAGVAHEMLGQFHVKMGRKSFSIGTGEGLTKERRMEFWKNRDQYIGQKITFQYQELSKYGVPRFPSWRGFRYE